VTETFPRQQVRTRRFTLGAPRDLSVAADGSRVAFLRSPAGSDPVTALWVFDVATGEERVVAEPGRAGVEVTAEELARRQRRREAAGGIVAYGPDALLRAAAYALDGQVWVADLLEGGATPVTGEGAGAFDPRVDPTAQRVAWCAGGSLWVAELGDRGRSARPLVGEDDPSTEVSWGMAEFVAAEEMGRDRGYWWSPDGEKLLVARVDPTPIDTWWIADPANPQRPPVPTRYPAAGGADADVTLWLVDLDGDRREVRWDRSRYPYLVALRWSGAAAPMLAVEQRNHRRGLLLEVDPADGSTAELAAIEDPAWVEWPPGLPARLGDGALVSTVDVGDTRSLRIAGETVTPPGLQVRAVHHVGSDWVLFSASSEPSEIELWRWSPDGPVCLDRGGTVGAAAGGGDVVAYLRRSLDPDGTRAVILRGGMPIGTLVDRSETPLVEPIVRIGRVGARQLRSAVLMPSGHRAGRRLPVLVYPYGGPAFQRVLADRAAWLESQWRADQGFAVLVTDGRGSPGRGPAWERAVHGDLATPVLDDQIDALHAVGATNPDLDLGRVGIVGWSFGGYLAALAVLRRPDVFHAAVAGAPVTDWRLYDTYYTERYLGHPAEDPTPYDACSLLVDAPRLRRPLLLLHGLADDNVLVAHSLRLSDALTRHGRPHAVIPLSGITHMTAAEDVAEHLLEIQTRFLSDALGA
jgi:dipeptidyl-peptidase-4